MLNCSPILRGHQLNLAIKRVKFDQERVKLHLKCIDFYVESVLLVSK